MIYRTLGSSFRSLLSSSQFPLFLASTPIRALQNLNPLSQAAMTPSSTIPSLSTFSMVNASSSDMQAEYGHFKLLQSFPVTYAPVTIRKWRSERTGLTVVVGSHATPIVSGGLELIIINTLLVSCARRVDTSPLLPRVSHPMMPSINAKPRSLR